MVRLLDLPAGVKINAKLTPIFKLQEGSKNVIQSSLYPDPNFCVNFLTYILWYTIYLGFLTIKYVHRIHVSVFWIFIKHLMPISKTNSWFICTSSSVLQNSKKLTIQVQCSTIQTVQCITSQDSLFFFEDVHRSFVVHTYTYIHTHIHIHTSVYMSLNKCKGHIIHLAPRRPQNINISNKNFTRLLY